MFYIFAELDIIMKTILIAGIHRTQGSLFFFFYIVTYSLSHTKKKKVSGFSFCSSKSSYQQKAMNCA